MSRETVVFVHGIWMPGAIMAMLKRRLESHGFAGRLFGYPAVRLGLDDNAARLFEIVRNAADGPVHLVGHSLGGVLALRMYTLHPDAPPGRIVCLGSPLCGSRAAIGLRRWRVGQQMLGRTLTAGVLEEAAACWGVSVADQREVGIIAGTLPVGLGKVIAVLDEDNDGTVMVSETRLPGASDHLSMRVTHTGLVWSRAVADQVAAFLRHGKFDHAPHPRRP